jgi:hypothetical protein
MTDDQKRRLAACQGICLLLGTEALMRIMDSMASEEFSEDHKKWMAQQRIHLTAFLKVLEVPVEDA